MPIENKIIREQRRVITRMFGDVSYDDVMSVDRELMATAEFDTSFDQLVDLTGIDKVNVSTEWLRNHAQMSKSFAKSSRCAIVVSSDFVYALARVYASVQTDRNEFQIFRSFAEAESWLGREKNP